MTDKELLERYPFLAVDPEYNYIDADQTGLYTERGMFIPEGWNELFLKCCEELREALLKLGKLDEFRINQLKEKYGSMRIYTNVSYPEIYEIINRYEIISQFTCCKCGKTATVETTGWVCPYCNYCIKGIKRRTKPIGYIIMTGFDGDTVHKHYYTVDNLPYTADSANECRIVAKNGDIVIPMTWTNAEPVREYLNEANSVTKTVVEISTVLEAVYEK